MSEKNNQFLLQVLSWGSIHQQRIDPADTMFVTTGRKMYVLGDIDGKFRPRSNPYDLYALGKPHPEDPLAERLQGVWAQPVKGLASYGYALEIEGQRWMLDQAVQFKQEMGSVRFLFEREDLYAEREDLVALDLPLLVTALRVRSQHPSAVKLVIRFTVQFDLQDAWFTKLADRRNSGQQVTVEDGLLVARAKSALDRWAVAVGADTPPDAAEIGPEDNGSFGYQVTLEPGVERVLHFGAAVVSQGGAEEARAVLRLGLSSIGTLRSEKRAQYETLLATGPHLQTPDPSLDAAFALARANIQMLEAEPDRLERHCFAGLEMFPFWFSNDGAYSLPGMLVAGLRETALSHTRIGLRFLGEGRVPHQISPAGHAAFAGNAQETPLWVLSIWDAYRWTGDREFLAELFPGAWKGMMEYVLGAIDPDGDGYPSGPGMVEVEGMGEEKLDSAAYTWAALRALAEMAAALGKAGQSAEARARAGAIAARFSADWWDEDGGTYAMSLQHPGNQKYPVPHWAVITPLEVGLAEPQYALQTFATLRRDYLNRWGIKHTVGDDERVWTLPTAALSRAAYRYGEPELGFAMLRHIAETLDHGSIGLFHEIIPQGACIIQLWSAATFLRGVVEDMMGIDVRASEHSISINPQLPEGWEGASLRDLRFGDHRVSIFFERGEVRVEHHVGALPIRVIITGQEGTQQLAISPQQKKE